MPDLAFEAWINKNYDPDEAKLILKNSFLKDYYRKIFEANVATMQARQNQFGTYAAQGDTTADNANDTFLRSLAQMYSYQVANEGLDPLVAQQSFDYFRSLVYPTIVPPEDYPKIFESEIGRPPRNDQDLKSWVEANQAKLNPEPVLPINLPHGAYNTVNTFLENQFKAQINNKLISEDEQKQRLAEYNQWRANVATGEQMMLAKNHKDYKTTTEYLTTGKTPGQTQLSGLVGTLDEYHKKTDRPMPALSSAQSIYDKATANLRSPAMARFYGGAAGDIYAKFEEAMGQGAREVWWQELNTAVGASDPWQEIAAAERKAQDFAGASAEATRKLDTGEVLPGDDLYQATYFQSMIAPSAQAFARNIRGQNLETTPAEKPSRTDPWEKYTQEYDWWGEFMKTPRQWRPGGTTRTRFAPRAKRYFR